MPEHTQLVADMSRATTRVTSPKGTQTQIFLIFFRRFWGPGPVPEASPGLGIEFPVKNARFGCVCVELCHFSAFSKVLESCEPLFADLGILFFGFQTWEELLKGSERV